MTQLRALHVYIPYPARAATDDPLPPPAYFKATDWFSQDASQAQHYDIVIVQPAEVGRLPFVPLQRKWQPKLPLPVFLAPEENETT